MMKMWDERMILGHPLPCIPDSQTIKNEANYDQKFVVSSRVSGKTNEIE
jgi:hypothetical protein